MVIPTTFVSGNSAVLSERKFASYVFAVSGPLPGFVQVCDRVYRPLAGDSGGYTISCFCRYPRTNEIARVFHRCHILVCDVWIPRAPQIFDMYKSRSAQGVHIKGSRHATRLQSNLCLIGNASSPSISRLSHLDATTHSIHLASELVCMNLISACLAVSHPESHIAVRVAQRLQPRGNA